MPVPTLLERHETAVLARDLSEFLVELSIGVHRFAMYPPGHPSLTPVVENVIGRLSEVFEHRDTLSIGIAETQLVIEGVATDPKHPVLSELARRLHDHQLGAISLTKGITASEVTPVLQALASETERDGIPLGLLPADEFPRWEHARFYRVGYEQLELADGPHGIHADRAAALWLGLAQAALGVEDPAVEDDPTLIARTVREAPRDAAYHEVVVSYMQQLATELIGREDGESEKVRRRISTLINQLDDASLEKLVGAGGTVVQRRRFLLDANKTLSVDAVMRLVQAEAATSEQTISSSMTRLLRKLAVHAEGNSPVVSSQADTALRENVEALIADWELQDPNPEEYTSLLDRLSKASPVLAGKDEGPELTGPERLLKMAIEVDSYGPTVSRAVEELRERGHTSVVVELVSQAADDNEVARRVREHLTSPEEFRRIVGGDQVDESALATLIDQMGAAAIDPLLDVLAESDSRSVRRRVFDVLAGLGPSVGERAVARMEDGRWFVLRNMLALLHRIDQMPDDFDPKPYLEHADARVRREALPLAIRTPRLRERALVAALADADERMVRIALLELQESVPEPVLPTLAKRVVADAKRSPEIRALGAKALGGSASALALRTLVELVGVGRSLLGRVRLPEPTPAMLGALQGLARGWAEAPEAKPILEAARRSERPEVRRALQRAGGGARKGRA